MAINLITDAWIPARMGSGAIRLIRPAEVADPELVSLAMPRPDLNGAVTEFLIGLLTTAAAPLNEEEWASRWASPPSPEQPWGTIWPQTAISASPRTRGRSYGS